MTIWTPNPTMRTSRLYVAVERFGCGHLDIQVKPNGPSILPAELRRGSQRGSAVAQTG